MEETHEGPADDGAELIQAPSPANEEEEVQAAQEEGKTSDESTTLSQEDTTPPKEDKVNLCPYGSLQDCVRNTEELFRKEGGLSEDWIELNSYRICKKQCR